MSVVIQMQLSIVVKRELSMKIKLIIYRSNCIVALTYGHEL